MCTNLSPDLVFHDPECIRSRRNSEHAYICRLKLHSSSWEMVASGQPAPRLHASLTALQDGQVLLSGGHATSYPVNTPEQEAIWAPGDVWRLNTAGYALKICDLLQIRSGVPAQQACSTLGYFTGSNHILYCGFQHLCGWGM